MCFVAVGRLFNYIWLDYGTTAAAVAAGATSGKHSKEAKGKKKVFDCKKTLKEEY